MNPPYLLVFFSSLTILSFEITLIRIFSIRFSYHYASLIISISMLGLVLGGIFAYLRGQGGRRVYPLAFYVFMLALSYPLIFIISSIIPFDHYKTLWEDVQVLYLFLFILSMSIPFFLYGIIIATSLQLYAGKANRIYAVDLVGAACGTAWAMFLLNHTVIERLFVASTATLSILLFFKTRGKMSRMIYLLFPLIFCLPIVYGMFAVTASPYKGLVQALKDDGARHIQTISSSQARLDVFSNPRMKSAPGLSLGFGGPVPTGLGIALDGDITGVFPGDKNISANRFLEFIPSALPFIMKTSPVVLIAGLNNGLDIFTPYYFGARAVYAAENNLSLLKFFRGYYEAGSIYRKNLYRTSGRMLMKDLPEKVDIVYLSRTGFFPSGAFGLAEDYDTTVDAIKFYLTNMQQDGILYIQIFILPPPRYELRTFNNIITALNGPAMGDYERHLIVFRTWDTMNFLIKPSGFTAEENEKARNFLASRQFDALYPPLDIGNKFVEGFDYSSIMKGLANTRERKDIIDNNLFDIRPTTDDRPFFHYFLKTKEIKKIYMLSGQKWAYFLHEGMTLPFLLLFLAAFAASLFLVTRFCIIRPMNNIPVKAMYYFGLIGFAFMFVEVYFLHKLILPLGSPVEAFSIVLVILLLSAGAGSMMSDLVAEKRIVLCMYILPALLVFYGLFFQNIIVFRYSFIFVAVPGILLGIFFPFGMRILLKGNESLVPIAYAVNGAASIVAPVLASVIAVAYGLKVLMFISAGLYCAALLLIFIQIKSMAHQERIVQ